MKQCSSCMEIKKKEEFYFYNKRKGGLRGNCKECDKAYRRARWAENPEKFRSIHRVWAKANPEKVNARTSAWKRANPEKRSAIQGRRRASKMSATPLWADKFIISEIYHLARIRTFATSVKWHVDHIVPLKSELVCGLHCESNLQVIPYKVNISKGNSWWPDMPEGGL